MAMADGREPLGGLARLEGDTSDEAHFLRVTIGMTIKRYRDDSDLFVNYDDLIRDCGPECAELMRRLLASAGS